MKQFINAKCFTELEGYECPITKFAAVPNIGDKVKVIHEGKVTYLKVIDVMHSEHISDMSPYLYIKLE